MKKLILISFLIVASIGINHAQFSGTVAGKKFNITSKTTLSHYMKGLKNKTEFVTSFYVEVKNDTIFFYEAIYSKGSLYGLSEVPMPLAAVNRSTVKVDAYDYAGYEPSKCFCITFQFNNGYAIPSNYYRYNENDILVDVYEEPRIYFSTKEMADEFQKTYLN